MHPDELAFTKAMIERPDDITLRLVFADWLEEHGQEGRARIMRKECAEGRPPQISQWRAGQILNEFKRL